MLFNGYYIPIHLDEIYDMIKLHLLFVDNIVFMSVIHSIT